LVLAHLAGVLGHLLGVNMALNIPMPGNFGDSFIKGFGFNDNLIKQIHERQQLAQQKKQHEEELALRKQAASRAGAMDPLRKMILEQQLLKLKHSNDPNYELQQFQNMMSAFGGGQQQPNQQEMPQEQQEMSYGEGQGVFNPEMMQEQQQIPQESTQQQGGPNLEALRSSPMLRGFFKHKFGFDPLASMPETPEQKHQGAINQAVSIDEAKATRKKIDDIEKTAQALLPYIGKVNTIEDILERKPDLVGRTTQLADLLGMTKDEDVGTFLSAAQTLQAHMAKELSSRGGFGVSKLVEQAKPNLGKSSAYNKGVIKDLKDSMKESFSQMKQEYERLSPGKKFPYNFEQYFQEAIGGQENAMVPMISPNGKHVMIPKDQVEAALAAGGKHG
jgi:hypothetical protein